MASVTRSTRRGEPSHPSPQQKSKKQQQQQNPRGDSAATMHSRTAVLHQATNGGGGAGGLTGRTKRSLDENEIEAVKHKRSRFSVDIPAKPRVINHAADRAALASGPAVKPTITRTSTTPNVAATGTNDEKKTEQRPDTQPNNNEPFKSSKRSKKAVPTITKKESKTVNGLKHELDRLKPKATDTKTEGRKLRSQEATKFKSELAAYFPDYDEVIGNEQKQQRACLGF